MGRGTLPIGGKTVVNATEADAPPVVDADADLPARILRFRIDGPLGAGGMADVFRAYDPMLERAVALKVLRAKQADNRRRRTLREARAAAALAHPNIITIYEVEEADGVVVIAMELLEGRVLRQAMVEPVSLATKLRWLHEMGSALAAAHARGLVHRDVKPENVFVCTDGPLKLLDFGIAKRGEPSDENTTGDDEEPSSMATIEGRRIGTPRYMAPEQHLGASTDARTDQHAWGLVAFELLTGRHGAAEVDTVAEGLARAEPDGNGERGRLLEAVPGLPAAVAAAVLRALSPSKEDRFPSMAPILAVLDDARRAPLASTPAHAPVRSRRGLFLALGAGLVVAAAGATYLLRPHPVATPVKIAATPAPVIARCHGGNVRTYPQVDSVAGTDAMALLPPGGDIVSFRPSKKGNATYFRERDGKLEDFAPMPPIEHARSSIFGGTVRNEPALLVQLHGTRTSFSFWSEAIARRLPMGIVSSRSFAHQLDRTSTTQAFGDLFAVTVGVTPIEDGQAMGGALVALSAGDPAGGAMVMVRPGERLDYPSAAGLSDRLAASFSTPGGIDFLYFDRRGNPSGPTVPVTRIDAKPVAEAEPTLPLMSALMMQPQAMSVYWLDRRDLGQMWVATANAAGDAFGPARVVLKESFSAQQPVVAVLPDGRAVLFWIANRRGAQTLRAAPILADGGLAVPSEIVTGTFRDLHFLGVPSGVAVGWIDDPAELVHALTVECATAKNDAAH